MAAANHIADKVCTRCGKAKPLSDFGKHTQAPDGKYPACKACKAVADAAYYAKNRSKVLASVKSYEVRCKDKKAEYFRGYRVTHREKIISYLRHYYAENKSHLRVKAADRYRRNREHILQKTLAWQRANPAKVSAYKRKQRVARPSVFRERGRRWRLANPEQMRVYKAARRALECSASGGHTAKDVAALTIYQRWKCAACRCSIKGGYHLDHVTPLARGGSNDRLNLQLLCAPCNLSKNARDPVDFMQSLGFLL